MQENLRNGMELFGPMKFLDFRFYYGIVLISQVFSTMINNFKNSESGELKKGSDL